MSMQPGGEQSSVAPPEYPDFAGMTEEEQIAYAMQMSMAAGGDEAMETEASEGKDDKEADKDDDYSEVISDPEFLQSVLESLPGVDPQSEAIRSAMGALTQKDDDKSKDSKKDEKK